jgi:hypothetical protein
MSADQPDDNLLSVLLAIAVIADRDQFAVFIVAFTTNGGDIVKDHLAIARVAARVANAW